MRDKGLYMSDDSNQYANIGVCLMTRVLLLDIGTPREELSEPIGIETIAPYVEEITPKIDLMLISLELDNTLSFGNLLRSHNFNIIGISTKIRAYDQFTRVIELIKEFSNKALVVVGDILATYAYNELLRIFDHIIYVRGEGEESMPQIIKYYQKYGKAVYKNLHKIPNLAFKYKNEIKVTERSVIDVKTARHPKRVFLKELYEQYGIVHLEASRGCIYSNCAFCGINEKYNGVGWRPFPLDFVMKELEELSNANFLSPYFTDEDFFGTDIQRAIEFCNRVIDYKEKEKLNSNMNFYLNARVDSILGIGYGGIKKSMEVLKLFKQAGLREIFIGVESGCKEQINRYQKFVTAQKNQRAVELLTKIGIDLDIGFIFFDPFVTLKDLRENINFIKKVGISNNYSRLLKKLRVEPFTKIGDDFIKSNPNSRINLDIVSYDYEFQSSVVSTIYDRFHEWESEDLDMIYNMQSFCRGEVESEEERAEVKDIISCYRYLDTQYLDALITAFENELPSENCLDRLTIRFREIRENMDDTLIDKMKWYDSTYRRRRRRKYGSAGS